jgi:hypothetical protein
MKILWTTLISILISSCAVKTIRNSVDNKILLNEKFYWVGANINGKKFDKAAMFVPINIDNLKEGAFAQFDLGSNTSILYQKNLTSIPEFNQLKLDSLPDGNTDDGKKVFVIRSANISIGKIHLGKREIYGFYNYGDEIKIDEKIRVDEKSIGTIGSDIVQNKVLIIDFRNETLSITDSLTSVAQSEFNFTDCKLVNNRIIVPIDINGQTMYFLYDTGASLFPMGTTKSIWKEISNDKIIDTLNITNFGNPVKMFGSNSKIKVKLADEYLSNFTVYYEDENYFDKIFKQIECDGIIGNSFFLNKKICIDYKTKRFGISK